MSTTTDTDTTTTDEWQPPRGSFLGDTWVNFKRWMRKTFRDKSILVAMIIQPIIWLILFTEVFQSIVQLPGFEYESYLGFFLPPVIVFLAMFSSSSAGISLLVDIESGMIEKLLATPVSRSAVFVGKSLAELLRIVIQTLIVLVMGYALGARIEAGLLGVLGLIGVALLYGMFFLSLSTIIGLYTQASEATQIIWHLVEFPLLFLSSAFLPLKLMPGWIQFIAQLNPMTYGIDAARAIMLQGWAWESILPGVGVLVALDLIFGAGAVIMLGRISLTR